MTRRLTGREHAARQKALQAIARAQVRAGLQAADGETPRPVPILPMPRAATDHEPEGLVDPVTWRRRSRGDRP